ncbi:MAG TPA: IS66 family transposase zinc-finger binding domain-containing protein [Methylocella sp.]
MLALDDLEGDVGQVEESHPITIAETAGALPKRKPLPNHLPREEISLDVPSDARPCCGGTMRRIGGSHSEMLDWVPARLRVIRTTRPKYAGRVCNKVVQAAAPERLNLAGSQHRRCSPRCSPANIAITCHSTDRRARFSLPLKNVPSASTMQIAVSRDEKSKPQWCMVSSFHGHVIPAT